MTEFRQDLFEEPCLRWAKGSADNAKINGNDLACVGRVTTVPFLFLFCVFLNKKLPQVQGCAYFFRWAPQQELSTF